MLRRMAARNSANATGRKPVARQEVAVYLLIQPNRLTRLHRLQLADHSFDHAEALQPESRVARVEAEGGEQLLVMLGAAGLEHREILVLEAARRFLVDSVE